MCFGTFNLCVALCFDISNVVGWSHSMNPVIEDTMDVDCQGFLPPNDAIRDMTMQLDLNSTGEEFDEDSSMEGEDEDDHDHHRCHHATWIDRLPEMIITEIDPDLYDFEDIWSSDEDINSSSSEMDSEMSMPSLMSISSDSSPIELPD